jgi:hypothetical protein
MPAQVRIILRVSGRFVECLVELADLRIAVVGVFTLGVGVMHKACKAGARAGHRPLQHLQVAVGVAESEDRAAADEAIDADRLARAVVDELDFRELHQLWLAIAVRLEFHGAGGADHLFWRNAVDLLHPRAHELDAATGDDESLEAVGAQVVQQLQHRLEDQLGVGPVEARMTCV